MLEFRTEGFQGYSTKYSPFIDSRLAVGASANFGLVGNGRLYILNLTPQGIVAEKWYDTQDSIFDVAWSEAHENQILAGSGDGTIKLFDTSLDSFPIRAWHEHKREVFSVHWNLVAKDTFCSSSWDGTVKIWSPHRPASSLVTLPIHSCTYSALWSPHSPEILSCVSSDSHLRIFDLRTPTSASNHLTVSIPIHHSFPASSASSSSLHSPQQPAEALTHDWNKYRPTLLATAGVDRVIRTFDLRLVAPRHPAQTILSGHSYAVRRLAWNPHRPDMLLSGSYDMTCRVWTDGHHDASDGDEEGHPLKNEGVGLGREIGRMEAHTEFVTGVDWCLFGAEGWCATCSWDERVLVWDVGAFVTGRY
ncbi:MAG: peroxisomal targeting signal 2 receptor [Peltula sp. TS41687]|nr:MAG: peroxisomal targeting signal 2 receptor [Peltula sp. TS41687]